MIVDASGDVWRTPKCLLRRQQRKSDCPNIWSALHPEADMLEKAKLVCLVPKGDILPPAIRVDYPGGHSYTLLHVRRNQTSIGGDPSCGCCWLFAPHG
jgi:hypothetical protein